jgi:hypothetical protein
MGNIMKYKMMSEMMKPAAGSTTSGGMGSMLPLMMMGGGMDDMFNGMFDFSADSDESEDE